MTASRLSLNSGFSRRRFLGLAGGAIALGVLGVSKCAVNATMALRGARLFTGAHDFVIEGATVAIKDDRIVAVGRDADVVLGSGTNVIDCAGAFVMPGLIDTHTHVTLTLVNHDGLLPLWARAGLTTVRDTGTIKQGTFLIRQLASELPAAPRIIAAGPIMTVPGGYPSTRPTIGDPVSYYVVDANSALAGVNAILDEGAEFIKIAVETGYPGGQLLVDAGAPTLNAEEIAAIVAAAHMHSATVSAHVTNEWELRAALNGGVDAIAHTPLDTIPRDLIDVMVRRRVPMTSTLNIWGGGPPLLVAQKNIALFAAAGGIVAMGTDYPYQDVKGLPLDELELMRGAGLSATEVLIASTRNAAYVCNRPDLGTIEEGKTADIVIVEGDPTVDLADLGRVSTVIQAGRVIG